MKLFLVLIFTVFSIVYFYGCDRSTGENIVVNNYIVIDTADIDTADIDTADIDTTDIDTTDIDTTDKDTTDKDTTDKDTTVGVGVGTGNPDTVGELDSNNTGANIDVINADRDFLLSTLFSSFSVGGGIDFFFDVKNRMKKRDTTTSWDTLINIDSIISGKSGTIDYSGEGVFSKFRKTEGEAITEYDSSYIETREIFYNYSSDSILFFGGESICKETEKDTSFESDVVQAFRGSETEVFSLNLRFNGKYRGNLAGTFTYHYHETEELLIDSSVTASFVLTSASSEVDSIKLDENDLAEYLK